MMMLGSKGAKAFLNSGVAGTTPSAKTIDIKCCHAWLADYLMRSDAAGEHPIGKYIENALVDKGVDISGTESCHEVCSGCSSSDVQVPIPRNRQRRKRRQIQMND